MRKILVTGGAGFIGSHVVDRLVSDGYRVMVFDNLDPQVHPGRSVPDYFNKKAELVLGDIRDRDALRRAMKGCECVYHFAAAVGVGQSQYEISRYVETNICGTANLLDILVNERHKVRKLIIAASMSSYGEGLYNCSKCGKVKPNLRNLDTKQVPLHKLRDRLFWEPDCPYCGCKVAPLPTSEDTPLVANSIYAITKKEQEEMALLIGKTYGIPVVSFRFFNVYGPRQSLSNPYTGVAAIFLSRIKNGQPPVIYEDGNQTRDFVWVGEVAQVVSRVAGTDAADFGIFNLGSGEPITILSIAEILTTIAGKDIKPNVTFRFRKGDVRHCFADISKIKKTLGFVPGISIMEGLKNLVNWSAGVHSEDRFEQAASQLIKKGLV